MKINIKGTNIELTPAISAYVEKKVYAVEKYVENAESLVALVEVGKTTQHHKSGDVFHAEVHITGPGTDLYAASDQADLYAAIDLVKDEIINNVLHRKGKQETVARRGGRMLKDMLKGFNPFKRR